MSNTIHYVSFPGLGIGEFRLDAVAFQLFGRDVRWYGIFITIGILLAFCYTAWRAKSFDISFDDLLDAAIIVVPGSVLGARIYFICFEYFGENRQYDSFLDAIAFWDGGLAIYGAIIAGAILVAGIALYKKIRMLRLMDAVAPAVMLGQIIGRWGNFTNGEAHGGLTDSLFRMGLSRAEGMSAFNTVHPTFLYESAWNLLGFVIINIFYKKRKFDGQWLLFYVGWYGLGRGFIELLRTDSLCIPGTALRISSILGFTTFALALIAMICIWLRRPAALDVTKPSYLPGSKHSKTETLCEKKTITVTANMVKEDETNSETENGTKSDTPLTQTDTENRNDTLKGN